MNDGRHDEKPPVRVHDKRLSAQQQPDAGEPPQPASEEQAPVDLAAEAQQLADDRLDQLMRLKADFENYRKRVIREQTDLVERASLRIVERLLPVLDDLERALKAARKHDPGGSGGVASAAPQSSTQADRLRAEQGAEPSVAPRSELDAIVRGVELVHKHLYEVLMDEGLERVDEGGAFDPQEHEAVSSVPGDVAEPTILEIVRPGYKLKGRAIRPALVHVSIPEQAPEEEGGE